MLFEQHCLWVFFSFACERQRHYVCIAEVLWEQCPGDSINQNKGQFVFISKWGIVGEELCQPVQSGIVFYSSQDRWIAELPEFLLFYTLPLEFENE